MKVSRKFIKDFAYIANLYRWDASDIDDAKAQTRADPGPMVAYWTMLANAHRAGYRQNPANGYMRLSAWSSMRDSEGVGPATMNLETDTARRESGDVSEGEPCARNKCQLSSIIGSRGGAHE